MTTVITVTLDDARRSTLRIQTAFLEAWEPSLRGGAVLRVAGQTYYVKESLETVDKLLGVDKSSEMAT